MSSDEPEYQIYRKSCLHYELFFFLETFLGVLLQTLSLSGIIAVIKGWLKEIHLAKHCPLWASVMNGTLCYANIARERNPSVKKIGSIYLQYAIYCAHVEKQVCQLTSIYVVLFCLFT